MTGYWSVKKTFRVWIGFERVHAIVAGNRGLIRLYEAKVKQVIARVWEG